MNSESKRHQAYWGEIRLPILLLAAVLCSAMTNADEVVSYTLRFSAPHTHYVEVDARIPTGNKDSVDLMMAVWTPGSYLVREYARHVEGLTARSSDGKPLAIRKTSKNHWLVPSAGQAEIHIAYRVYCHDLSVRGNWVVEEFAFLNGAPTFITPSHGTNLAHEVRLVPPQQWPHSYTGLASASPSPHHYRAADFDVLVDSPILLGNLAAYTFSVEGKDHLLVNQGEDGVWDGPRSVHDTERIVRQQIRLWGDLPYDRYLFLNVLAEGRGGLEHSNSTLLLSSRWHTKTRKEYLSWLSLVSHEFFHTWNIKRLRPQGLGPFNYDGETYTHSLWVVEGITTYYADLILVRAGLCTPSEYLALLSRRIERLQNTPGRLTQPLGQASFDAWIKFYRPDENSRNTAVSSYTKGAVVGFLLDAEIRRQTQGTSSLDDVLRLAYARYGGARGFTEIEFRATASEVARTDLKDWFTRHVDEVNELDYSPALEWFGLRFDDPAKKTSSPKETSNPQRQVKPRKGWLGLVTSERRAGLVVTRVVRGTPGYDQGFNVDDEILAIDGFRVRPSGWEKRLERYPPGTKARVLVARRDKLIEIEAKFGEKPSQVWKLKIDPKATPKAQAQRSAWLEAPRRF